MEDVIRADKYTKTEAQYTDKSSSPAEHRCGICTYIECYPGQPDTCKVVEGDVVDMGGCRFFDVNLIKWANDPITLSSNPPSPQNKK